MACVLALWRVGADMAWTGSFAIHTGLLSHWQVWLLLAIGLQVIGMALNRYGNSEDEIQETEEHAPAHEHAPKVGVR